MIFLSTSGLALPVFEDQIWCYETSFWMVFNAMRKYVLLMLILIPYSIGFEYNDKFQYTYVHIKNLWLSMAIPKTAFL